MDLTREFIQLKATAEVKMKLFGDEKINETIAIICKDNPSLVMDDVMQSIARSEIKYLCCHPKCKRKALKRGFCDSHLVRTRYEMMEEETLTKEFSVKNGMLSF